MSRPRRLPFRLPERPPGQKVVRRIISRVVWKAFRRTTRKVLPKKLAEALERLDDLKRLVSDWVWETDPDLVLTFISPRVNEVLGFHPYELAGRPLGDLPLQPNETLGALKTREGRRPFRDLAVEIADRPGETRQFLLSGLPGL